MTTKFNKPVYRETEFSTVRSGGKQRPIKVGLIPGDLIELKLKGERKSLVIAASSIFYHATALEALRIKRERAAARKAKGLKP